MKYSGSLAILSASALISSVAVADSESFGMIAIDSGSYLQYASIYPNPENGWVQVGGSASNISAVITDKGYLKFSDGSYISTGWNGQYIITSDLSNATSGWSVENNNLLQDNEESFVAVPYENIWNLYDQNAIGTNGNTNSNSGIAIYCASSSGEEIPNFSPSESSSASTASSSPNSSDSSNSTVSASVSSSSSSSSSSVEAESSSSTTFIASSTASANVTLTSVSNSASATVVSNGTSSASSSNKTSSSHTKTKNAGNNMVLDNSNKLTLVLGALVGLFL